MSSKPPRPVIHTQPSIFSGTTIVSGGTFTQHVNRSSGTGGFQRLADASAPAAFHDSEQRCDPPKCHPNTRICVLERITDWTLGRDADPQERRAFMMWLYGAAGAGKSAIAQTIAEQQDGRSLLATFFFSRTDPTRNNTQSLVATLAYQIALKSQETKSLIEAAAEHDPLIFSRSLETQFERLIFEPLRSCPSVNPSAPYLIIIDGLDECEDSKARCNVLRLLMNARRQCLMPPTLKFLIASRPELDIRNVIDLQELQISPKRLVLDDECNSDEDIRLFLQDKFQEIKLNHPHRAYIPSDSVWPSCDVINRLVENSSGQFIYASTVVNYVTSEAHKPTNRLDIVLGLRPARREAPFAALDELYTHIFSTVDDLNTVLQVLGCVILAGPHVYHYSLDYFETLLNLEHGDLAVLFSTLGSIISIDEGLPPRLRILHASLADFLLEESRSKELYIYPAGIHAFYTQMHLREFAEIGFSHQWNHKLLFYHLNRAILTADLHKDITQFSLNKVYNEVLADHHMIEFYFYYFVHDFLSYIKALPGEDGEKLHALQQWHFDQLLIQRLPVYYEDAGLNFLLATFYLEVKESSPLKKVVVKRGPLPEKKDWFGRGLYNADKNGLGLLRVVGNGEDALTEPYCVYLRQLLCDPARCGAFTLTDERYAEAALYLYEFISDISDSPPQFATLTIKDAGQLLNLLARLIDHAGKSEPFIGYIAEHRADFLSATSMSPPDTRQLALDAVEEYVKRMNR